MPNLITLLHRRFATILPLFLNDLYTDNVVTADIEFSAVFVQRHRHKLDLVPVVLRALLIRVQVAIRKLIDWVVNRIPLMHISDSTTSTKIIGDNLVDLLQKVWTDVADA